MAFNPAINTNFEIREAVYENKASLYLSRVIITHRIRIKLIHTNETNPRTSWIASHCACYHWIAAALRSATRHDEVSRSQLKLYCNDTPTPVASRHPPNFVCGRKPARGFATKHNRTLRSLFCANDTPLVIARHKVSLRSSKL